ncbi:MAG: gluconokinase [Geminicoccaceae bacterium]
MAGVIIVMGVSGVGKTTVGQALASALDADFAEGDNYHPKDNVEKMRSGQPLTDDDRWPWLDRLRAAIEAWLDEDRQVVLACSALKSSYRERLSPVLGDGPAKKAVRFVYLHADHDVIEARLSTRKGHYMPASLLESQLTTLEPPSDAIVVDATRPLEAIIDDLVSKLTPAHAQAS